MAIHVCPACGRTIPVHQGPGTRESTCPACGAPSLLGEADSSSLAIRWDRDRASFHVEYQGDLNQRFDHQVLVDIALSSRCECGGSLTLGDYDVREKDGELEFKATYTCDACRAMRETKKSGLLHTLARLGRSVTKLSVKADGIEIEKEPDRTS